MILCGMTYFDAAAPFSGCILWVAIIRGLRRFAPCGPVIPSLFLRDFCFAVMRSGYSFVVPSGLLVRGCSYDVPSDSLLV